LSWLIWINGESAIAFLYRECPVIDGDEDLLYYWNKYWALPEKELLEHNYHYRKGWSTSFKKIIIANDEFRKSALLFIHHDVRTPMDYAPGLCIFFIEDEIITLKLAGVGFRLRKINEFNKRINVFKVMPYTIPAKFFDKENYIKNLIEEAFEVLGFCNKYSVMEVIEVQVLFDQTFVEKDFSY
jgi:hypothetical protein